MQQPYKDEFINEIILEVIGHFENKHWTLIPKGDILKGEPFMDSVWAMKRKREIKTRRIYKWKAGLNVHGIQQ